MKQKSKTIIKGIAIFLAVLAVITGSVSMLLLNSVNKLTDISVYKQAFLSSQLYQKLPGLLSEETATYLQSDACKEDTQRCALVITNPLVNVFINSTPEARKSLAETVLEPEYLQRHLEKSLDDFFESSNTQSGQITLVLPLEGIKEKLQGDGAFEAANNLIRAQETCTYEQMRDLGLDIINQIHTRTLKVPYCHVPEFLFTISPIQNVIHEAYNNLIIYVPSQYKYTVTITEGSRESAIAQYVLGSKTGALENKTTQFLLASLPVLLLTVASIMAIRTIKSFLKWWGIPMLVTGLLGLLATLAINQSMTLLVLPQLYLSMMRETSTGFQMLAGDIIWEVVNQIMNPIILQSGILAATGLVMTISAVFLKAPNHHKTK